MKRLDRWRIGKREIRYDWKNFALALLVEVSLFSVILVLLTITTELDGIFDRYLQQEMSGMYSVTVKNIRYSDLKDLANDGIDDLFLYSEQFGDGYFYTGDKKMEDYSLEIVSSEKEYSGVSKIEEYSECPVWIPKEMQDEFGIEVGNPIEYRYGEHGVISCVAAGVTEEKDGYSVYVPFRGLDLYFENQAEKITFQGMGTIDSFVGFDFLQAKWKKSGVSILADDLEEVLSVIFFMKALFVGLSVIGMVLCIIAVCNIYGIKIDVREEFITMLMRMGMREKYIKSIFFDLFFVVNVISVLLAYIIAGFSLSYFNSLLRDKFDNMYLVCDKLEMILLGIFVAANILMLVSFKRRWARRNMK